MQDGKDRLNYMLKGEMLQKIARKELMLHCAGYFFTLNVQDDTYKAAVDALNEYFSPIINLPYERHIF